MCDNNIVVKKEDCEEEAESEETHKTRSAITFKQSGQGIQGLLNYAAEHHSEFFSLFKQLNNMHERIQCKNKLKLVAILSIVPIMFSSIV